MNYPSRTDDTSAHPDRNQSPHHLSSDLTTKADLNGIVNLREQRSALSGLGINHEEERVNPVDQAEDQSAAKGSMVSKSTL
ncbi:NRAMP-like transporter smf-3 [Exophiala xenobiotica]|nr:NRAMP-like transporter smf-3 [Exophiala xenobiotica]KAK5454958.1 NRAMP-like transporter smf-3 [Exophiala xenobiotica]